MQYLIMTGNPVDGFLFVGPYDDEEYATSEAEHRTDQEWWVVPLTEPWVKQDAYHINVYERYRNYGGPEEGGWWFDSGVYKPQLSVTMHGTPEEVNAHAIDLQDRLNREADEAGVPPLGSVVYHGGRYLVVPEDETGADWPAHRPHYE